VSVFFETQCSRGKVQVPLLVLMLKTLEAVCWFLGGQKAKKAKKEEDEDEEEELDEEEDEGEGEENGEEEAEDEEN